jgi:predicted short-subunit dehydrogenase-like oxidoreductase (DUF2520 family)
MKKGVIFVGMGRVGTALALALKGKGYTILAVDDIDSKALARAEKTLGGVATGISQAHVDEASALFITTGDDAIQPVANMLSEQFEWRGNTVFVHTSGSHVSSILGDRPRLSLHPLQSFARVEEAIKRIPLSVFTLEGDRRGLEFGRRVTKDLGVPMVEITPEKKPLYHLAACVACNYAVTLVYEAKMLLRELGFSADLAEQGLLSLLAGTVTNMERLGVEKAITGPIMRGDLSTIKTHLRALEGHKDQDIMELYLLLGRLTAKMVLQESTCVSGKEDAVREIERLLGLESRVE